MGLCDFNVLRVSKGTSTALNPVIYMLAITIMKHQGTDSLTDSFMVDVGGV
jgi:hypothetical protein